MDIKGQRLVVTIPKDVHAEFVRKTKKYDKKLSQTLRALVKAFIEDEIKFKMREEGSMNFDPTKHGNYLDEFDYHAPPHTSLKNST